MVKAVRLHDSGSPPVGEDAAVLHFSLYVTENTDAKCVELSYKHLTR